MRPRSPERPRGVLRKRPRDRDGALAHPEAARHRTRARVAFAADVDAVLGVADALVDRTPHGDPQRCGGCGLHCLGARYACAACEASARASAGRDDDDPRDAFALCAVCFAAHVRVAYRDAIDDASAAGVSSPGRTLRDETASPATASARGDAADIIRAARELAASRGEEDEEEDDGLLEDDEAIDVDDRSTDAAAPSPDPDGNRLAGDLAASSTGFENEGDGEPLPPSPAAFAGVHEHSPGHFRRLGDDDAAAMDVTLAERRAFRRETGDDAEKGATGSSGRDGASDDDFAHPALALEAEDGASLVRVGVGAPAGLKPDGGVVSGKSGETWDYVSEII
jgi:hypothetical protein